jgi:hypothetical protein
VPDAKNHFVFPKKLSSGYSGAPLDLGLWLREKSGVRPVLKKFLCKNSPKTGENGKKCPFTLLKFFFGNFFLKKN